MRVERAAVVAKLGIDYGKIQVYHKKLVVQGCWVFTYIQVAIKPLKLVGLVDVVVVLEHRHGEAFPESARSNEEKEFIGILHFLNKTGLIHIVAIVFAYGYEVHHAIRYALSLLCYCLLFHNHKNVGYAKIVQICICAINFK